MKTSLKIILTALLIAMLTGVWAMPVMAGSAPYTTIQTGFTVDPTQPGTLVTRGSKIYHLANGVTQVDDRNNVLEMQALDSQSSTVITPYGVQNASYVYGIPNGSIVKYNSGTTQVFDGTSLILTVVGGSAPPTLPIPDIQHWVAETYDNNIDIDYFDANWSVPDAPPNTSDTDYYFNGIESNTSLYLFQPVLQWNQPGYSGEWSIESWGLYPGALYKSGVSVVSQGTALEGLVYFNYGNSQWTIDIRVVGAGWNGVSFNSPLGPTNDQVCTTLEVWRTDNNPFVNNDLPGSGYFANMVFKYTGSTVPITWAPDLLYPNLNIGIYYDHTTAGSWTEFITPN